MRVLLFLLCLSFFSCDKVAQVFKEGSLPDSLKFGYQGNRTNYTPDGRVQEYSFQQSGMHYILYRDIYGGVATINVTLDSLKLISLREKLSINSVDENYVSTSNSAYSNDGLVKEFSFQQSGMNYIVYRPVHGGLSAVNISLDNLEVMLLSLR